MVQLHPKTLLLLMYLKMHLLQLYMVLVVLTALDIARLELVRPCYSEKLNRLFDETRLFNNTKWLMIRVESDPILEDVKRLFALKLQP